MGPDIAQGENNSWPSGGPLLWSVRHRAQNVMSSKPEPKSRTAREKHENERQAHALRRGGDRSPPGASRAGYLIENCFNFFLCYYKNMHALCRKFKNTDKQTGEN